MTMNETKTIEVLGAGESGVGAAILAADRGYEVYVSDSGAIAEKYRRMLEAEGIHYLFFREASVSKNGNFTAVGAELGATAIMA